MGKTGETKEKREKHPKQKSKVKNQIQIVFLLSVILPVWVLGLFSITRVRSQLLSHYSEQLHADSMRVNSILFDTTISMYNAVEALINNISYMRLLGQEHFTEDTPAQSEELNDTLNTIQLNMAAISSLAIYTNNPLVNTNSHIIHTTDYSEQDWYQNLPKNKSQGWVLIHKQNSVFQYDYYELCLIRRMGVISNKYSAYLVLCIDNNYLANRLEQTDSEIIAALEDTTICYASNTSYISKEMNMPEDFNGGYYSYTGPKTYNDKKVLVDIVTFQTYQTNDKFYIAVSDASAYPSIERTIFMYIVILLIASIIPAIVITKYSSYFSNRVTTLRLAMHQASKEDYSIIERFPGDDELAETFIDLMTTIKKIQKKEALYYESKINEQQLINKQQQMEYHMLASQINPHFLYNTLETIRMQAISYNCPDVATSIKLLGKSMHYVLENTGTSTTTLQKELDYTKTYLAIQKLRFGDRVNAEFNIPESCDLDSITILPLLLQPIVENAISHGLEDIYGTGHIVISIRIQEEQLQITVSDDGIGMDETTLQQVREQMKNHASNDAQSIGLYNINQRIKLFYGDDYSLQIESEFKKGTTVILNLPCRY